LNPTEQFAGTVLVNVLIGVFVFAQLAEKVKDLGKWSKKQDAELSEVRRDHGDQLRNHEGRISHIEGQRNLPLG
jgi:hypothetical protein